VADSGDEFRRFLRPREAVAALEEVLLKRPPFAGRERAEHVPLDDLPVYDFLMRHALFQ
jgi:hypothetical protein